MDYPFDFLAILQQKRRVKRYNPRFSFQLEDEQNGPLIHNKLIRHVHRKKGKMDDNYYKVFIPDFIRWRKINNETH